MRILHAPPSPQEFVPVTEFQASAPASFALEENPVLHFHQHGTVSGSLIADAPPTPGEVWVASDAVYVWIPALARGNAISYGEITLHGAKENTLYLQLDSDESSRIPEFKFESPQAEAMYSALSRCLEAHDCLEEEQGGFEPTSDTELRLEGGQADDLDDLDDDDDNNDPKQGQSGADAISASTSVLMPALLPQKRRRNS